MTPPRRLVDRRQRRRQRWTFWAVVGLLLGYVFLVGDHRPHHLAMLWKEDHKVEKRLERLEAERERLSAARVRLERDSLALEELAREKGMIRPGDIVYRIVPVSPDVRRATAESLSVRAARERAVREAESLAQAAGSIR